MANSTAPAEGVFWLLTCRFLLAVVVFVGMINLYAVRVNLSVAIVCMVNHTAVEQLKTAADGSTANSSALFNLTTTTEEVALKECPRAAMVPLDKKKEDGEFVWNEAIQGQILGIFFWGYLISQVPGGILAIKFGTKKVFGIAMCAAGIATLLTPVAARLHYIVFMILRFIVGLGSGVAFPCMHHMWANWAPPLERSRLVTFSYAGTQVGNMAFLPLSGLLCKYGFAGGWPSVFYVIGMFCMGWLVLWLVFAFDSPEAHPRISDGERNYIEYCLKGEMHDTTHDKGLKIPWLKLITSLPVWSIIVCNCFSDFGAYLFLTLTPSYLKEVLKFDIESNSFYSAVPYIGFAIIFFLSGFVADFIRTRGLLSTRNTRKLMTFLGFVPAAVAVIALGYMNCFQWQGALCLLTLGIALTGCQFAGFYCNHLDICPKYAGIVFGIANMCGAAMGPASTNIAGLIRNDATRGKREQWQIIFYLTAAVYCTAALFYLIFASGELQPWARDDRQNGGLVEKEMKQIEVSENGDDCQEEEDNEKPESERFLKQENA